MLCSRYVRRGEFIRLKRDMYVLERNWERYGFREFFRLSNVLQVPSYVSFSTALAFHGWTTQQPRNWYESATWRRTSSIDVRGVHFAHRKIQQRLYFGFVKEEGFFVAEPEKALLDAAYLASLGRYALDWNALDSERLDMQRLLDLAKPFPERVLQVIREQCRT